MLHRQPQAKGIVTDLALNGEAVTELYFDANGPHGDIHAGWTRKLSGHDGGYIRTSNLHRGDRVFNWRSWTGLSAEEISDVETVLRYPVPVGCILENIRILGIPNFSQITPASRLVFPQRDIAGRLHQTILAVWEENGPCDTVGKRLEAHYGVSHMSARFVKEARGKRGVTGFVLSSGLVLPHDEVLLYPPER